MPACYEGSMARVYSCNYNWPVVLWNTSQNVLIWAKKSSISIFWIVEVRERKLFYIVAVPFTKWKYFLSLRELVKRASRTSQTKTDENLLQLVYHG